MSANNIAVDLTEFEAQMAHLVLGLTDNLREPIGSAIDRVVEKLEAAGVLDRFNPDVGDRCHER